MHGGDLTANHLHVRRPQWLNHAFRLTSLPCPPLTNALSTTWTQSSVDGLSAQAVGTRLRDRLPAPGVVVSGANVRGTTAKARWMGFWYHPIPLCPRPGAAAAASTVSTLHDRLLWISLLRYFPQMNPRRANYSLQMILRRSWVRSTLRMPPWTVSSPPYLAKTPYHLWTSTRTLNL